MSLNLNRTSRGVMCGTHNFSTRTNNLLDECIQELVSCGVPVGSKVCYFYLDKGVWNLNLSTKSLGYLSTGNEDKVFKDLLESIGLDFQGDFDTVIFPNSVVGNPFGSSLVVLSNEGEGALKDFIESKVRVIAYSDRNSIPHSLNNFCFRKGNGKELKEMMLSCGSAKDMANKLNKSGFGYRNWIPVKDDYKSMKIASKDSLGNIFYIEVVL